MATEIITSFIQQTDSAGDPVSGAKVYVYDIGTTTPRNIYSDPGLTIGFLAANPIICDAYGRHDMRYTAIGSYKIVVKTSADVTIYTRDYVDGRVPVGSGALAIANGGTGATNASAALTNLGAATAAELAVLSADLAALSGSLASTEKTHIATGTTAQRPASPVAGDIRYNTSLGTEGIIEFYDGAEWRSVSFSQPPNGAFRNLVIKVATNTTLTATADMVVMSNGTLTQTGSLSATIDLGVQSSANGLDNATPVAIDTFYFIWAIAKPDGTTAGLASTSSTSPTMPTGYTYKARIGAVRTIHASATLYGTWQYGRRVSYVVGLAQTTAAPVMTSGASGSTTIPTWTAVPIGAFVPSTASVIHGILNQTGGGQQAMVAPNSSYGPVTSTTNQPFAAVSTAAATGGGALPFSMALESTNIYWASSNAGGVLSCSGWEDNI